jgi:nicotinamidase/pyrazinamidase
MAIVSVYQPSTALIVVDVQNDFADAGGSLYVPGGETIVEPVNQEMLAARAGGATIVVTQDWHPPDSPHFEAGGGKWPPHCVRRTWGAELHSMLDADADLILRKGTGGRMTRAGAISVRMETGIFPRPTSIPWPNPARCSNASLSVRFVRRRARNF